MKYLLDTDVISQYRMRPPNPRVDAWIQRTDDREMYISDITYAELWHGIHRLPAGNRRTDLENWVEGDLYMRSSSTASSSALALPSGTAA